MVRKQHSHHLQSVDSVPGAVLSFSQVLTHCYGLNGISPASYVNILELCTQGMTVFGDRAFVFF